MIIATQIQIPENAACLGCGYSLHALTEPRCPECGRAFDPADNSTYRDRAVVPQWRVWAEPPGTLHIFGVILTTLLTLVGLTNALPGLWVCCPLFVATPFFMVVYAAQLVAVAMDQQRAERDLGERARLKRGRFRWLVTPVCLVLVLSAFATRWPMLLRFAASRAAFEAEAQRQLAARAGQQHLDNSYRRYVGLYFVHRLWVDQNPPRVHFVTTLSLFEGWGFVYEPQTQGSRLGLPPGWDVRED